jgi:hypothetical protein
MLADSTLALQMPYVRALGFGNPSERELNERTKNPSLLPQKEMDFFRV